MSTSFWGQFSGEPTHALSRSWWLKFRRRSPLANVKGGFQLLIFLCSAFRSGQGGPLGDLRFQSRFLGCYPIFKFMRAIVSDTANSKMLSLGDLCQSEHSRFIFLTESAVPSAAGGTISRRVTEPVLICHASEAIFKSYMIGIALCLKLVPRNLTLFEALSPGAQHKRESDLWRTTRIRMRSSRAKRPRESTIIIRETCPGRPAKSLKRRQIRAQMSCPTNIRR